MSSSEKMVIEVAYAEPDKQVIIPVSVDTNLTVEEVIRHSGILDAYPEIDLAINKVGVFGKLTKLNTTLREGDRIEIYRALIADPKAVRAQRAAEGKKTKKGGSTAS